MKRYIFALIAAALLAVGCGDEKKDKPADLTGEWELTGAELTTKSIQIGTEKIEVYISFTADGKFELYQKLGAGFFDKYAGTYTLAGNLLSGKYTDGKTWGNIYEVSVSGTTLTMTATENSADVYTYTKCTIPESVK